MFATLLYFGREIYQMAPPIPETVVSQSSQAVFSREEIQRGQNVWQSMGGMQQGSIWGHGSYLAPDWSADWLHREAVALLDVISREEQGVDFDALALRDAEWMRGELRLEMRENTYDAGSGSLTISDRRAEAVDEVGAHFRRLFMAQGEEALHLREQYALPIQTSLSAENAHALNAFFFWTAWAATTERPGGTTPIPATGRMNPWLEMRLLRLFSCGRSFPYFCCLQASVRSFGSMRVNSISGARIWSLRADSRRAIFLMRSQSRLR